MKRTAIVVVAAALSVAAVPFLRADKPADLARLARDAVSADAAVADAAVARLRAAGPAGLEALLAEHADLVRAPAFPLPNPDRGRLCRALKRVGKQYDCHASRLYWYTDLEEAKSAAESQGKPILSLRLLGRLDEECSCANSRFFRTVLYANQEISEYLREHYVLHWKSVRPVPKVTIDFGDGRKLERTLTGNSIHYVLAADGRPVEALPGLLGPKTFLMYLQQGRQLAAISDPAARRQRMKRYHTLQARKLARSWAADLAQLGVTVAAKNPEQPAGKNRAVPAGEAAPLADSKIDVERPLLAALNYRVLDDATDDALWERIAALHAEDAVLDEGSRGLIAEHNPELAHRAMALAFSKRRVEDPLLRLVNTFQRSVAVDTVRNEYRMHRRLHEWFAAGSAETAEVDKLNERVYAELFLTPSSDPWLGLVPADVYTALHNNGVIDER